MSFADLDIQNEPQQDRHIQIDRQADAPERIIAQHSRVVKIW